MSVMSKRVQYHHGTYGTYGSSDTERPVHLAARLGAPAASKPSRQGRVEPSGLEKGLM